MDDKPIKVLLIEDNPGDARLIRECLSDGGKIKFDMEYVDQLSSGLDRLTKGEIEIVLLDLSLPDSEGVDTFAEVYSNTAAVPVIILTGTDDETLAINLLQKGAQDYLVKGQFDSNLLVRSIRYAIERKQKEDEIKRHAEQLEVLYEIGKKITSIISKEELLPWIAEQATKLLDADVCNYRIREGDYLVRAAGTKEGMELMVKERVKIGESLSGLIARDEKPLIVEDLRKEQRYLKEHREAATKLGFRSFLGVPMIMKNEVIGVINLYSRRPIKFTKKDVELLSAFADQAAIAYQNAILFEDLEKDLIMRKEVEKELQHSMEKLRKAMSGIIHTMALTVEAKDPYTAGHQKRVANLARSIAKEMNLPDQQIDAIRMAGTIHDLGKISVPGEILSKPGKINETEFDLIKDHTQVGYDILKEIEFPWPIAKIVLQHHERMDGSGYPGGLSGEDIIIEARILAVADVVEAMAFHRPYRPALGIKKALEEITKNKGIIYDSQVVDACLKLFTKKGFELK